MDLKDNKQNSNLPADEQLNTAPNENKTEMFDNQESTEKPIEQEPIGVNEIENNNEVDETNLNIENIVDDEQTIDNIKIEETLHFVNEEVNHEDIETAENLLVDENVIVNLENELNLQDFEVLAEKANEVDEISDISIEQEILNLNTDNINNTSELSNEDEKVNIDKLITVDEIKNFDFVQLFEKAETVLKFDNFLTVKAAFAIITNRYKELESEYFENKETKTNATSNEEPDSTQADVTPIDELEGFRLKFEELKSRYSYQRRDYLKNIEAEKVKNYELKSNLLNDLKQLIESDESLRKTWDDFKLIQSKWKEIGHVPQALNQELWNNFNFLVDKFLDKVKLNKELRDLDSKKNLERKIEICEKLEELSLSEDIEVSFKKVADYQNKWREIGPVPSLMRDELNARYLAALNMISSKRKDNYENFRQQLEKNLEIKKAFITKIKEINEQEIHNITEWNKKTEEVEELMKMWRSVGIVPKKENNQIWEEFQQENKTFYNNKRKYFEKIKDEQLENYNKKLLLCKQAEALQDSNNWKKTTEELIALQEEWKTIGTVPRRYADTLWKQFRSACDTFFNNKQAYFANAVESEQQNYKLKENLIEQIEKFEFSADNQKNLAAIKEFQKQFYNIGRVPIKHKDIIQNKFQEKIDVLLQKLNISKKEQLNFDLKNKYETLASSKGGGDSIKKESFQISSKISKLESDIKIWENNVEFFAKSKNADILTKEFRDKIESAKSELLILKQKLKMIKSF